MSTGRPTGRHTASTMPQIVTASTSANISQVALTDGTVSWDAKAAAGHVNGKAAGKGNRANITAAMYHTDIMMKTPDGEPICFKYSRVQPCPGPPTCSRLHVCQFRGCHLQHPMTTCAAAKAAGCFYPAGI